LYFISFLFDCFQPSSSSRAASFLHQEGQTGFIGFSNLQGNTLGYVPQVQGDENELSGDLQMFLRKMTKKDTVTKLKVIINSKYFLSYNVHNLTLTITF